MTDLETLATRLEQAGPESQAGCLHEAYIAIYGHPPDAWPRDAAGCDKVHGNHFVAMINEQQGERSCRQNSGVRLKRRRPEVSPEPLGRLRP